MPKDLNEIVLYASSRGDRSVGIEPTVFKIIIQSNTLIRKEILTNPHYREYFRKGIVEFGENNLTDEYLHVNFDDECVNCGYIFTKVKETHKCPATE